MFGKNVVAVSLDYAFSWKNFYITESLTRKRLFSQALNGGVERNRYWKIALECFVKCWVQFYVSFYFHPWKLKICYLYIGKMAVLFG